MSSVVSRAPDPSPDLDLDLDLERPLPLGLPLGLLLPRTVAGLDSGSRTCCNGSTKYISTIIIIIIIIVIHSSASVYSPCSSSGLCSGRVTLTSPCLGWTGLGGGFQGSGRLGTWGFGWGSCRACRGCRCLWATRGIGIQDSFWVPLLLLLLPGPAAVFWPFALGDPASAGSAIVVSSSSGDG